MTTGDRILGECRSFQPHIYVSSADGFSCCNAKYAPFFEGNAGGMFKTLQKGQVQSVFVIEPTHFRTFA
jgi:hypothetical protein